MKIVHHIPTEQFGFTEVEVDETAEMSYSEAKSLYGACGALQGMSEAEFRPILDKFLVEGTVESGLYEKMSAEQQMVMQCIKRSIKRIKSRE